MDEAARREKVRMGLTFYYPAEAGENDSNRSQVLWASDILQSQRWVLSAADGTLKAHFPKHGTKYALGGKSHYAT